MLTGLAFVKQDIARYVDARRLSKTDAEHIVAFFFELKAKRSVSDTSIKHWYTGIAAWIGFLPFSGTTMDQVLQAKVAMEARSEKRVGKRIEKGALSGTTLRYYLYMLRRYLLWCGKKGYCAIPSAELNEIKLPKIDNMTLTAEQLLTDAEVSTLINAAVRPRDRFLIALSIGMGARPVEIVGLDWNDILVDEYGLLVNTAEKTGIARKVRVLGVTELYGLWKNEYRVYGSPEGTNPVFVELKKPYGRITYQAIRDCVRMVVARSGLKKDVFPYLFRHTAITKQLAAGVPEQAIKKQHWGSERSAMLSRYSHLTSDDADRMILAKAGIIPQKGVPEKREDLKCPRCFAGNTAGAEYCIRCGQRMDAEAQIALDQRIRELEAQNAALKAQQESFMAATIAMLKNHPMRGEYEKTKNAV